MSKKSKSIDIILVDDRDDVYRDLNNLGKLKRINIRHIDNGKDAIELFQSNKKYKGFILDGKCKMNKDSDPNTGFLMWMIDEIKKIESKNNRYIPFVIFSALSEKIYRAVLEESVDKENIFQKGNTQSLMLERIVHLIKSSDQRHLEMKYKDAFQVFEKKYLENKSFEIFYEIIKELEKPKEYSAHYLTANMRIFIDAIFEKMNKVNNKFIPDDYVKGINKKGPFQICLENSKSTNKEIKEYMPSAICNVFMSLYKISSSDGSHFDESDNPRYFFKGRAYDVLLILSWFGKWMDKYDRQ